MNVSRSNSAAAAVARSHPTLRYTLTPAFSANKGPVVVLMSGWPDQPTTLYASLMRQLAAEGYRTAIVELPGYAPVTERPLPPQWWGWDFPEVVARYAAAVRAIQIAAAAGEHPEQSAAVSSAPLAPVTFITHDWGAGITWALVAAHPYLARAVAAADIGDGIGSSAAHVLFCVLYMSVLAAAFVIGGPLGDAITRRMARALGAPHPETAAARMNSLYYWMVRGQVVKIWRWLTGAHVRKAAPHWGALPACPTLYLYGIKKGVRFEGGEAGRGAERGEEEERSSSMLVRLPPR